MLNLMCITLNLMNPFAYSGAYAGGGKPVGARLTTLSDFGTNPGSLRALTYIPANLPEGAPLVIVLHGSEQTAERYDLGSGWSELADRHGFALLFPEQRSANNWMLGFNWFKSGDNARGAGEPLSIMQMIDQVARDHAIDRGRIFITGLSAGGAMTSIMLATYPELFAGGAIIAGLPYGSANSVPAALRSMKGRGDATSGQLAARLGDASDHDGPWPTLSIWHGSGDTIVDPSNSEAILDQWLTLQDLSPDPAGADVAEGCARRVWRDADGHERLEAYRIDGMGHGAPLKTGGRDGCGESGDYMLEANISSTHRIAAFWGLTRPGAAAQA